MKKYYLIILLLGFSQIVLAQRPFITTWETTTDNESITIPATRGGDYDYSVDWGDGTITQNNTGPVNHQYAEPGIYTVQINGKFPSIHFGADDVTNREKILSIEQWGDIEWSILINSFEGCKNLNGNASDVPDLTKVQSLQAMFSGCSSFNHDISNWDVSTITSMTDMFLNASSFNQDISSWDVSNVSSMNGMFSNASAFNQEIGNWDVSKVTTIMGIFSGATSFNGNISSWDVSNVISMFSLFRNATSFNQDIGDWNVSNVLFMNSMFSNAISFNQDISNWNVNNVSSMSNMFNNAILFNQDLSDWDVSNVTNMASMFENCSDFNQSISLWNVSNVANMSFMFRSAESFNQSLSEWDVSSVTTLTGMFQNAKSFNQDISTWDVSNVQSMYSMFNDAISFNQNINSWDVHNVNAMSQMFSGASAFNQPLDQWNTGNVRDMYALFNEASSFNQIIGGWDVSSVIDMDYMFRFSSSFNQDLGDWDVSQVTTMVGMLDRSGLDFTNYDKILEGWVQLDSLQLNVQFGADDIEYCNAESARQNLINDFNWAIKGDLKNCKLSQTIFFDSLETKTTVDPDFTLKATATSGLEISYISSDTSVATISGDVVSITGAGTTEIKATQTGNNNYEAASPVTRILIVDGVLNNAKVVDYTIQLYPNPVKNRLTIESSLKIEKINVFDLRGVKIIEKYPAKSGKLNFELSNYPAGIYLIKLNDSSRVHRLVKQ